MRPLLALTLLFAFSLPLPAVAGPKTLDAELMRIQAILDRGEQRRARGLYKTYLGLHPESEVAREGYEEAGGDLKSLGLGEAAEAPATKTASAAPVEAPQTTQSGEAPTAADIAAASAAVSAEGTAPMDNPSWWQRAKRGTARRMASAGRAGLALVILLGIGLFFFALGWSGVQIARWHQRRHFDAMLELSAQRLPDGSLPADLYIELRFWSAYWGFGADSERITNEALRALHVQGWDLARLYRQNRLLPQAPSTKLVSIWLISLFSLGFMNYYSGPTLWLRRQGHDGAA